MVESSTRNRKKTGVSKKKRHERRFVGDAMQSSKGSTLLGAAMWFGDVSGAPTRVGDAGVAIERGSEVVRLLWCDMDSIKIIGANLVIAGDGTKLELPVAAHKLAVAWVLKEAAQRVPDVLDIKRNAVDGLPEARDTDGERLVVKDLQIAGRRCAESDEMITLERDARVCESCGQVYHHHHVPQSCVTCEAGLDKNALRV